MVLQRHSTQKPSVGYLPRNRLQVYPHFRGQDALQPSDSQRLEFWPNAFAGDLEPFAELVDGKLWWQTTKRRRMTEFYNQIKCEFIGD